MQATFFVLEKATPTMQFDARAAKLLKAGEHLIVADSPGLRLVATAAGRAWIYRYKSPIDGRMRQLKIGQWPALSIAAATTKWEELRQARENGRDPAAEKKDARFQARAAADIERGVGMHGRYTVRKLCDHYVAGHIEVNRKEKGARQVREMFDRELGELAAVEASSVTRAQVFDWLTSKADRPVLASMLRRELGAAWDYALDAGRIPETSPNWWRLVMRGRLKSKGKTINGENIGTAKRVLNESELGTLIEWLPNFSGRLDDALTLYLWTGARGSEIVSMHASEIVTEADGLWWVLPKVKTKNARFENATDHRVPLVGRAERVVRRRLEAACGGYLFAASKGDGHSDQTVIQAGVYSHQPYSVSRPGWVRHRLTVTHWSPHSLRRSVRTLLASMGCPDAAAEAILGHMQPGIKGVYNLHAYDQERREWLTKLDAKLEEIVQRVASLRSTSLQAA